MLFYIVIIKINIIQEINIKTLNITIFASRKLNIIFYEKRKKEMTEFKAKESI